jgi:mercuric ion binding protein
MKTVKIFLLSFLVIFFSKVLVAQTKTENFKVSGECGTCKKKIEAAAKKAGATYALWNIDTKQLTIKYNGSSSNTAKIEQAVANAGYDTPEYKATDDAYNQLDDCCKYDRGTAASNDSKKECCTDSKCMKDGKCVKAKDANGQKDCCTKS